jgi:hypothetical protein
MGNKVSFALKLIQVIFTAAHAILAELICTAWELTQTEFLSGTPLSVLINQTSSASANLSLASIPAPDPLTSEDCLFLDVFVPKSIFDSNATKNSKRNDNDNKGGEFSHRHSLIVC